MNRFQNPPFSSDKEIKKEKRGHTEQLVNSEEDVVLVRWLDNKKVILASNFVGEGEMDVVKRWEAKQSKFVDVPRPEIVKQYNHGMGGVDLMDRMLSYYRIFIKSKKWPLRLIFHAVDLAIVNSWFEYKAEATKLKINEKDILSLLHFKLKIADDLINVGKVIPRIRGRPSTSSPTPPPSKKKRENRPSDSVRLDTVDHLPEHDGKPERSRCKNMICKNGKTNWKCLKCGVHLCLSKEKNCFKSFHLNK